MNDNAKNKSLVEEVRISKFRNQHIGKVNDFVAVEAPLQIEINGRPSSITMRTPGDDVALSSGFLFTEGLIHNYNDIASIVQKDDNTVNITSEEGIIIQPHLAERNFYATSSCGVCGKSSIDILAAKSIYIPAKKSIRIKDNILLSLQDKLLTVQSAFEMTGGLHACALFSLNGTYTYHSEDVGRHNALDKLIGHALMAGKLPLDEHILLLSGRASFELIQKASMAGIQIIVAVGAPSSLAIELAVSNELTLVGFLKKNSFNIYCGEYRIEMYASEG